MTHLQRRVNNVPHTAPSTLTLHAPALPIPAHLPGAAYTPPFPASTATLAAYIGALRAGRMVWDDVAGL